MIDKINILASELDSFIKETKNNGIKYFTITNELIDLAKNVTNDIVSYNVINMYCIKDIINRLTKIIEIMDRSFNKDRFVLLHIVSIYAKIYTLQLEHESLVNSINTLK